MDTFPLKHTKWSDRLAFDVALMLEKSGETVDEVIARHKITSDDMLTFNQDPVFLKKVDSYRGEIQEKGITFRLKARAQAEELLTTSWTLIHSAEVSASVKADLIKSTVKWANLEPKNDPNQMENTGGVKIMINLGGEEKSMTVIESEPVEEEVTEDEPRAIESA